MSSSQSGCVTTARLLLALSLYSQEAETSYEDIMTNKRFPIALFVCSWPNGLTLMNSTHPCIQDCKASLEMLRMLQTVIGDEATALKGDNDITILLQNQSCAQLLRASSGQFHCRANPQISWPFTPNRSLVVSQQEEYPVQLSNAIWNWLVS